MAAFSRLIPVVGALLFAAIPELRAAPPASYAVASESARASREAVVVLSSGGNAVDAAVTSALVAGVTNPSSSGLGGGGFALVFMASEGKAHAFDFRETAPAAVDPALFEGPREEKRGKLVGVPGELAGLFELHRRFGKKPWKELVLRAESAARRGFAVEQHLSQVVTQKGHESFQRDAALKGFLYPAGKALGLGQNVRRPALARTLYRIAQEGPKAFYTGPIAAEIARVARDNGGALVERDLETYKVMDRAPLRVPWEGLDVLTMPAPSAGGLMLAQVLALNSRAELRALGHNTPAYVHVLAEGMRGALADRYRYLGDPDHVKVDLDALVAGQRMAARKARIAVDRTQTVASVVSREQGTHHLVTIDPDGNAVSLTTTVNGPFGADLMAPASGVILNDELADFSSDKDMAAYGPDNLNRARAGARPVSSMTPTLVIDRGRVRLALGGSGGTTIPASVIEVLLSHLAFEKPLEEAVKAPRFFALAGVPTLRLEKGFLDERQRKELEWRGERAVDATYSGFAAQAIAVDKTITAVADERKHGSAEVR